MMPVLTTSTGLRFTSRQIYEADTKYSILLAIPEKFPHLGHSRIIRALHIRHSVEPDRTPPTDVSSFTATSGDGHVRNIWDVHKIISLDNRIMIFDYIFPKII